MLKHENIESVAALTWMFFSHLKTSNINLENHVIPHWCAFLLLAVVYDSQESSTQNWFRALIGANKKSSATSRKPLLDLFNVSLRLEARLCELEWIIFSLTNDKCSRPRVHFSNSFVFSSKINMFQSLTCVLNQQQWENLWLWVSIVCMLKCVCVSCWKLRCENKQFYGFYHAFSCWTTFQVSLSCHMKNIVNCLSCKFYSLKIYCSLAHCWRFYCVLRLWHRGKLIISFTGIFQLKACWCI